MEILRHFNVNDKILSEVKDNGKPYLVFSDIHESVIIAQNNFCEKINNKLKEFDKNEIIKALLKKRVKLITIQRSKGYSTRKSISIDKIEKVINEIRSIDKDVIIMIDNCYGDFVSLLT